ncbi:MAG: universal stress protein [Actinomycetota bacterium]
MERIVVAVDDSEPSTRAAAAAERIAARVDFEVVVVHVLEVVYSGAAVWTPDMSESQAKELVEGIAAGMTGRGIRARGVVCEAPQGRVAKELLDVAADEEAEVVVVGSRGRSRLESVVLGSTAYRMVHLAKRPVLLVP